MGQKEGSFADLVRQALDGAVTPERVQERVDKHVDRLVDEAIQGALATWSDLGKQIKQAVSDSLQVGDSLNLPAYGHVVGEILAAQIQANVSELVSAKLEEDMRQLLQLAPKKVRLSELIAELLAQGSDPYGCEVSEVYLLVEGDDLFSSVWVYLHNGPEPRSKHDAHIRLLVHLPKPSGEYGDEVMAGTISSGHVKGSDLKKDVRFGSGSDYSNQSRKFGQWFGFEQKILALYAVGTVITLDEEDCVLSSWED